MSVNNNFPTPPRKIADDLETIRQIMRSLGFAMDGKLNCTGEVTLDANADSTVVKEKLCTVNSYVSLSAMTVHASNLGSSGYIVPGEKIFTIHHPNNPQTDRTFKYVIIG